jgi:hypothetical protein
LSKKYSRLPKAVFAYCSMQSMIASSRVPRRRTSASATASYRRQERTKPTSPEMPLDRPIDGFVPGYSLRCSPLRRAIRRQRPKSNVTAQSADMGIGSGPAALVFFAVRWPSGTRASLHGFL